MKHIFLTGDKPYSRELNSWFAFKNSSINVSKQYRDAKSKPGSRTFRSRLRWISGQSF